MNNIAIVAITYNRPKSLLRLLESIHKADYINDSVDLIISIDKSEKQGEVFDIANKFNWNIGKKIIRKFEERQGLRNHILQCGDLVRDYDAIIMFEDDIIVSENFYRYTKQCLQYFSKDDRIAGISLYSPQINEMLDRPFIPLSDDSDIYFMKSAQSWGQCWSQSMWHGFKKWYENNSGELIESDDMPSKIYSWPKSSWKKYYMKYIVETNKYFVYPRVSLSSNASDVGQHVRYGTSRYQVPLQNGEKDYKFKKFEDGIKYDVFFEYEGIEQYCKIKNIKEENICVDLYGSKKTNQGKRYLLTTKNLNYDILLSYGLKMKPHEANILNNVDGNDIYLFDLKTSKNILFNNQYNKKNINKILEFYSSLDWKDSLKYGILNLVPAIINKIKRI